MMLKVRTRTDAGDDDWNIDADADSWWTNKPFDAD